jgi:transposase
LTDALGNLVRFLLLPGHRYDTVGVAPLISDLEFDALVADKAFDANWIIDELNERGAKIVISQRPQRVAPLAIDEEMYKGVTSSKTSSANSKSSSGSRCAPTKPIRASRP